MNISIQFSIFKLHLQFNYKVHFKQITLNFRTKITQKGYFFSKTQKMNMNIHFTVTHRKTSNFYMRLLDFIYTCQFCISFKIDKISFCFSYIYRLKRNRSRFSLLKFCRSRIHIIAIVKFGNRPIQNLFYLPQRTSTDLCKVH